MSEHLSENVLRAEKRRKLHKLREMGINPYPYSFDKTASAQQIKTDFAQLEIGEKREDSVFCLAGRVMAKRPMGKAAFFNIQDQTGIIQCYLKTEELAEPDQQHYEFIDIGDIVGVEGFVFKTKKGELSIHCQKFIILCKTLEPLPEKFHGITDIELKYRRRCLDLIMDPKSRQVFETRTRVIREIRKFLDDRGFMEVETPILQTIYGGASANPFSTHHNALDMTLYMKISPELYLKRLIVGGFEKVYDLGRNFRNEGIDRSHNPEFTMLEWYEAYTDYNYQMKQYEELISHLVKTIRGSTKITYQGKELDFTTPWRRLSIYDGLRQYSNINPETISDEQLFFELKKRDPELERPLSRGEMLMELFELTVEKHLWHPTFVIDHPEEVSPLTKIHRGQKGLVERFEPVAAHMEIGNAYSELNDPEDQRRRLLAQEAKRVIDSEAHPLDEDFLFAIDVGMPPTGGVGVGIDRIVMLLTDSASIRDVILFPTLKRKIT